MYAPVGMGMVEETRVDQGGLQVGSTGLRCGTTGRILSDGKITFLGGDENRDPVCFSI